MKFFKISLKGFFITLVVLAVAALGVWFFFIRETTTGVANSIVDAMKDAKTVYESKQGTPEAYDAANECATAALEAKKYRDELKKNNDESGLKEFDEIYQPVKKEVINIVLKEEVYEDEDEANALFAD